MSGDWLSKVEKRINQDDEGEPLFRLADVERMARVLRELAGWLALFEIYDTLGCRDLKYFSDDAKELLKQD